MRMSAPLQLISGRLSDHEEQKTRGHKSSHSPDIRSDGDEYESCMGHEVLAARKIMAVS